MENEVSGLSESIYDITMLIYWAEILPGLFWIGSTFVAISIGIILVRKKAVGGLSLLVCIILTLIIDGVFMGSFGLDTEEIPKWLSLLPVASSILWFLAAIHFLRYVLNDNSRQDD